MVGRLWEQQRGPIMDDIRFMQRIGGAAVARAEARLGPCPQS